MKPPRKPTASQAASQAVPQVVPQAVPLAVHPMRRRMILKLLVAGGFAPVLVGLATRVSAMSKTPIKPGIQSMQAPVRINGVSARPGAPVRPGDVVATGAGGECVIVIGEHVFLMREHSEIEFYAEDFEAGMEGGPSGLIRIVKGAMLSVFGSTETTFETPFATIGIRGTACYIDSQAERTYACVCYGDAVLSGTQDGQVLETVSTRHHDAPRYIRDIGAPVRIETAPVIDHTDDELRMLEALVGRRPAFDRLIFKRGGGNGGGGSY